MVTGANGRRISTHEATVKTAAVEIKALTISGKQVTLAVFRQLIKEDLIDEKSGDLMGVPWGTINYFWGECAEGSHLHVVWQKGMELRRSCLTSHPSGRYYSDMIERLSLQYLHVQLAQGWRPREQDVSGYPTSFGDPVVTVRLRVDDYPLLVNIGKFCKRRGFNWEDLSFNAEKIRAHVPTCDEDDAYSMLQSCISQRRQVEAKWKAHYQAISQLDQLFIAV
jgi:hypothetical protein